MKTDRIAKLSGDGIGMTSSLPPGPYSRRPPRGSASGWKVLWSCDYLEHGRMMPKDGIAASRTRRRPPRDNRRPARVPDSISLHGLLLSIRKAFTSMRTFGRTA